jgi:hypothetical protein
VAAALAATSTAGSSAREGRAQPRGTKVVSMDPQPIETTLAERAA